jgi:hypothetical protein
MTAFSDSPADSADHGRGDARQRAVRKSWLWLGSAGEMHAAPPGSAPARHYF